MNTQQYPLKTGFTDQSTRRDAPKQIAQDDLRAENYPISAGHQSGSASQLAASEVDRDPERKIMTQALAALVATLYPHWCMDEIATEIGEPLLYARPRISELISLGILAKGGLKISPTHRRQAHAIIPTSDTKDLVDTASDDDEALLFIRALIEIRIADMKVSRTGR